jgi:ketosteroid isomerase-like protein
MSTMDCAAVDRWLERYVEAWKSGDSDAIGDLFSEEAEYRYQPYADPLRGRAAIVRAWLQEDDPPGTFDAEYRAVAVDGDTAVATGTSTYREPAKVYDNAFVLRFDGDGRCREFTEWYMQRPPS